MSEHVRVGIPLSSFEIESFLRAFSRTPILLYKDLPKYRRLADLFTDADYRVVFLSSDMENIGHWVVILDRGDNIYEYFDPLGYAPDALNPIMNEGPMKDAKYFNNLRSKNPKDEIHFFKKGSKDKPLQASGSNTCGKWCIARILAQKISLRDFIRMYNNAAKSNGMTPDKFIDSMMSVPRIP